MNRWILAAVILCGAAPSDAAVISRDWKAPGDGLLTYDDVNQREWLDLTESRLAEYSGATFEERFQSFLPEISPGGSFEGFGVAKTGDLVALAASAGISSSLDDFSANQTPTIELINLVGISLSNPARMIVDSYGLLDETVMAGSITFRNAGILLTNPESGPNGQAGLAFSGATDSIRPENTGVWLFRPIPEPNSIALGVLAACGIFMTFSHSRSLRH